MYYLLSDYEIELLIKGNMSKKEATNIKKRALLLWTGEDVEHYLDKEKDRYKLMQRLMQRLDYIVSEVSDRLSDVDCNLCIENIIRDLIRENKQEDI